MKAPIMNQRGFTLIEIIISLIVAGIMGAMLVSFTGTILQNSSKGVFDMVEFYRRNQIIDNITADYIAQIHLSNTLQLLKTDIDNGSYDTSFADVSAAYITYTNTDPPVEQSAVSGDYLKVTTSPASGIDGTAIDVLFTQ
jgi:prepilin-type N-terminal cleavage/methylation domain-containing protein